MAAPLKPEDRRKSILISYLTAEQKAGVVRLADATGLTQSDLVRLLVVTATVDVVERAKRHPAYLAILEEESIR